MAQLYFKYGAMNSGKSIDILKTKHNYERNNRNVMLFTSGIDNRTGIGTVSSRIGLKQPAVPVFTETNIFEITKQSTNKISCVLIDEAQFLSKHHVYQLTQIVDDLKIPVIAYGLKNDFKNELFEGSKELLLQADKLDEIKTVCHYCNKKATMNLRLQNKKPVYDGSQIQIGDETYQSVCRQHYYKPKL